MDQIRPWLFIGKYRDTLQPAYLKSKSIQAMLQLAEKVEQPDIVSLFLPVEDVAPISVEHIRQGVGFIRDQKQIGKRVLVACGAGINRSSAFCAAALKEEGRHQPFRRIQGIFSKKRGNVPKVSSKAWLSRSNLRDGVPCPRKIEMIPFKEVKKYHPESLPHEPVWYSLCNYYKETTPYLDIMRMGFSIG
jgi:hypothetical protein